MLILARSSNVLTDFDTYPILILWRTVSIYIAAYNSMKLPRVQIEVYILPTVFTHQQDIPPILDDKTIIAL